MTRHSIDHLRDMAVGEFRAVKLGNRDVLVFRLDDGYYATQSHCTHTFAPLRRGKLVEGHQIQCPLHRARFDVRNGEVVEWANWPKPVASALNTLRKEKALASYPIVEEDGVLYLDLPEA